MSALADNEIRELYRELILDHAKSPRHFGAMPGATHRASGVNPLCGDRLELYLQIDDGRIVDAAFEGTGCAISVASASMMSDEVIGLPVDDALQRSAIVSAELRGEALHVDLGKLEALKGVRQYPSRVKCATLAWHALGAAIEGRGESVRTE